MADVVDDLRAWDKHSNLHPDVKGLLLQAATEIERLRAALNAAHDARIEAQNPGIDMDEVRRLRGAQSDRSGGAT